MTHVIIMRGLPGAGKSTMANIYASGFTRALVVSADAYFRWDYTATNDGPGTYAFDPSLLPQAHAWCMREFLRGLAADPEWDVIIVDNTNSQHWEYASYVRAAKLVGASTQVSYAGPKPAADLTVDDLKKFAARNVHGVPFSTICAMAARWEKDYELDLER